MNPNREAVLREIVAANPVEHRMVAECLEEIAVLRDEVMNQLKRAEIAEAALEQWREASRKGLCY